MYRVRAFLQALRESGVEQPRILFTTYTHALIASSQQLLAALLDEKDVRCVDVCTVDQIVDTILLAHPDGLKPQAERLAEDALIASTRAVSYKSAHEDCRAWSECLAALGPRFLMEEIETVIAGQCLNTLAEYQAAKRPGRPMKLGQGPTASTLFDEEG